MTPLVEGLPAKAKEALSPHEVRLAPLDTNPVFQCLGEWVSYCGSIGVGLLVGQFQIF